MIIEDGAGKGNSLRVDKSLQIGVRATNLSEEEVAIMNGDAYIMDIDGVGVDTADYVMAYIHNNYPDKDLIITGIFLEAWENKDQNYLQCQTCSTITSAANHTAIVPANRKSGSGNTALGTFYVNDGGGDMTTFTNEVVCGRFGRLNTEGKWFVLKGGWCVPYGLAWNATVSIGDTNYNGCITFYYRDKS